MSPFAFSGLHRLPVLVNFGLEALFDFRLLLDLLSYRSNLPLESLLCSHDLALQVETTTLLRVVGVEQSLVSLQNLLNVRLAAGRGLHVENLARLVESHARGERSATAGVAHLGLMALVIRGGLGLLVSGHEGSSENSGAC